MDLTVKVAELCPAEMVTLAGTVATAVLLLASLTTTLAPVATGPVKAAVPVDVCPPTTEVGLSFTDAISGAFTVSLAVFLMPLKLAVMVAVVVVATGVVAMVKAPLLDPAGMVMLLTVGWATEVLLLERLTVAPPAGAMPFREIVPVELWLPVTAAGLSFSLDRLAASTVTVPAFVT